MISSTLFKRLASHSSSWTAGKCSTSMSSCLLVTRSPVRQMSNSGPTPSDALTSQKTKIEEVMEKRPRSHYTVLPNQTLQEAAQLMLSSKIGCLLVVDPVTTKMVGVLSERDYLKTSLDSVSQKTEISKVMTPREHVSFIDFDASLQACMGLMISKQLRHAPVWNKNNPEGSKLLGMVSIRDIVRKLVNDHNQMVNRLQEYISGTY